jgi:FKBP-type peptidyl-prolyl cis-trans isomerase FklB
MRYLFTTIVSVGLLLGICQAAEKIELKDQKERESYSFGYQFGQALKAQGIDLDLDTYLSGVRDALSAKEPSMSADEIRAAINGVQQRVMAEREKALKEQSEKNLSAGKSFLAENGKKEGVKMLPSGLEYRIIAEGDGPIPKPDEIVTVHYRGSLLDGTEFDSSYKQGEPVTFPLQGIIAGWSEVLQLMKTGSKWQIFLPPELAYGERSPGPAIPPNSTLIFEIELIAVNPAKVSQP